MDNQIPGDLAKALNAFEAGPLDQLIRQKRPEHFEALQRLVSTTPATESRFRQKALYALGRWGDPSVVPLLVAVLPALADKERMTAIDALGRLGTDDAREAIVSHTADPSPQVRKFVVEALARLGGTEASASQREMAAHDPEDWIRDLAVRQRANS